jgi:asparagine synthase (glutamine-hydrolysing)
MCGITGFISTGGSISANKYYEAHLKIAHRGPDDEGFFAINGSDEIHFKGNDSAPDFSNLKHVNTADNVHLIFGHRRLSIIDLSSAGHQPFEFNGYIITYNGEIYNYIEIKSELEALGVVFKTSTDTEVFIASYITWGVNAFKKFNGMWAAVIYNIETKEVVFSRDRFGVKPLYYAVEDDGVYFSSEIKFFKELIDISNVNSNAVFQYLRYSEVDYSKDTFFENVKQILPGNYAVLNSGVVEQKEYWNSSDLLNLDNEKNSLEKLFSESVSIRLRSDVKVGALLSGGIDSSLIIAFIKELRGLDEFESFSAVFKEEAFSEKKFIDKTALLHNFTPTFIYPEATDLLKNIHDLIYIQELPFRSLSVLSQYLIYKEVGSASNIRVLLNGQGADEIFTGYTEHYYYYFLSLIKSFKFLTFLNEVLKFKEMKSLSFFSIIKNGLKVVFSNYFVFENKYNLFNSSFDKARSDSPFISPLKNKLYGNLNFSALREYLRYEDRNSMKFSLESRLPFLDFRLVKAAFSLRDSEYIKDGLTKFQLRKMGQSRLAEDVRLRKDKTGFVSPQELWQKNELKGELDKCFMDIEKYGLFDFINTTSVVELYEKYKLGKNNDWAIIWRIYCLYQWKKVWISGEVNAL